MQINALVSGPSTAENEKHLKGLTELPECVSDLLVSANGWPDKSCVGDADCYDECCFDQLNESCYSKTTANRTYEYPDTTDNRTWIFRDSV